MSQLPSRAVGARALLRVGTVRVVGDSMLPTLSPGDRLLVRYDVRVRPGSLAIARFADGAVVVKRVGERRTSAQGGRAWWLLSDNPAAGTDSRHRGAIAEEAVLGRVVARIWPSPRSF